MPNVMKLYLFALEIKRARFLRAREHYIPRT